MIKKLIKNLSEVKFHYFSQQFQEKQLQLAKRKGIHSYEYMNSSKKFDKKVI